MTTYQPHPVSRPDPQPSTNTPRILVIANRTCPCPTLVDEIAGRVGNADSDVLIIAPALNSRLRHWVSDVDGAIARAHDRVDLALAGLHELGINARGRGRRRKPPPCDRRCARQLPRHRDRDRHPPTRPIQLARAPTGRKSHVPVQPSDHPPRIDPRTRAEGDRRLNRNGSLRHRRFRGISNPLGCVIPTTSCRRQGSNLRPSD
jgi:hypothetical protein